MYNKVDRGVVMTSRQALIRGNKVEECYGFTNIPFVLINSKKVAETYDQAVARLERGE